MNTEDHVDNFHPASKSKRFVQDFTHMCHTFLFVENLIMSHGCPWTDSPTAMFFYSEQTTSHPPIIGASR